MQAEMASKGNWPYENAIDWSKVREEKGPNRQKNNPPLFAIVPAWEGAHLRHWSQKSYLAIAPLLTHSHLAYNEVLWWFLKLILRLNKLLIGKLKKRRGMGSKNRIDILNLQAKQMKTSTAGRDVFQFSQSRTPGSHFLTWSDLLRAPSPPPWGLVSSVSNISTEEMERTVQQTQPRERRNKNI